MEITRLQSELAGAYDRYLLTRRGSLFYYCSKYKDFLKRLLGCEEEYLLAVDGGEIKGVLPLMYREKDGGRVYNSLPYYGSNGGVTASDRAAYRDLISAYNDIACDEATVSSTVIGNPLVEQDDACIQHNYEDYRIGQFTDISFRTDPRNEIMARIDASAGRNVKKALREGVTVEVEPAQMARLRQMHQDNISAIGGMPKADDFFSLVPDHFTPGQDFNLYVAKKDGVVIAGLLLFYFNSTVEYYTPAIDEEYRSIQPLSLILLTAMIDAARQGYALWNWGGTWGTQTGVYRFKKKWGAVERNYTYHVQLNDRSILGWSREQILSAFPNFYVAPFSALKGEGEGA
jgi:Acetyltransferase (GNAT) domain